MKFYVIKIEIDFIFTFKIKHNFKLFITNIITLSRIKLNRMHTIFETISNCLVKHSFHQNMSNDFFASGSCS